MMGAVSFELLYAARMQALACAEKRQAKLPPVTEVPQHRLSVEGVMDAARSGASLRQICVRYGVTQGTLACFMHRNGLRLTDFREDRT